LAREDPGIAIPGLSWGRSKANDTTTTNLSRWSCEINPGIIAAMILAGDIGGTNTRLAVFDPNLQKLEEKVFKNVGRGSLQEIITEFRQPFNHPIDRACFAVAGPVAEGKVTLTNLSWHLEEKQLAEELKVPRVGLINDLMGHAEGIEVLGPEKFVTLHAGRAVPSGQRAVIAAGTGLGEAGLFFDSKANRYRAFPSEGGHADFSPTNEEEDALLHFLRGRMKRVFWEMVLSGRGMRNLYDFYCSTGRFSKNDELPDKPEYAGAGPSPAEISGAGLSGASPVAVAALEFFARLYGAEAGNLALKLLATGGVYLGGGIAPKIVEKLKDPRVLSAFWSKSTDKLEALLRQVPVHVINFDLCGLYGAANYARHM
jgi:glucokinase